jgi:RNA polymerase sigma factor (sigma-70 family)
MSERAESVADEPTSEVTALLVANHREFLRYVERRVGDEATAQEILQEAFVRTLDRGDEIRESAVGWFYGVLRNAVIDHQRRRSVANRRLDEFAAELELAVEPTAELEQVACLCVTRLADTLKPEYADALKRIEVDGMAVKDYADAAGITASNAGVRIFRAREALRKQVARSCGTCAEHGCLDCCCQAPSSAGPA